MIRIKNEKVIYTSSQYHKFYINERILKNTSFIKDILGSLIKIKLCTIIPSPIGGVKEWFECSLFKAYCIDVIKQNEYEEVIDFFKSAIKKPDLLYLLQSLQDFEKKEYDDIFHNFIDDIEDIIPIAYTTVGEDEQYEIQVNFNLKKLQWEEYINDKLKNVSKRDSVEDFINELNTCSFDDIIRDIYHIALDMEEREEEENERRKEI